MFVQNDLSMLGIITEFRSDYERRENISIYKILSCFCCCLSCGKSTFYCSSAVVQTDTIEE